MSGPDTDDEEGESTSTELIEAEMASFPRARLQVFKGPEKGAEVVLEGQTVTVGSDETCQLKLSDPSVSRRHFELSGGPGGYRLRDLKSTNGTFIDEVQVLDVKLTGKARITVGRCELRFEPETEQVQWPLSAGERFGEAYGQSAAMRRVFAVLERAAKSDSHIVLEGEAGTGKELLARGVHQLSGRSQSSFVAVDLSALSEQLMEVDLFGRGLAAFTQSGAHRPGAFEEADGGTLYLDEVTALSPALQARVARALESRGFKRASGTQLPVNARVVASTQKDLGAEVKAGRFREDLYFQLAVFSSRVPALRERPEDIEGLVRMFEARIKTGHPPIANETLEMLYRHDWPGNVRELRNVVERLCAFPDLGANALVPPGARTEDEQSGGRLRQEMLKQLVALPYHEAKERVLDSFEKAYFTEHLRAAGGVVTRAAQRVGLPRQSVHRMLRRLGMQSDE